jgi:hypothetical protein
MTLCIAALCSVDGETAATHAVVSCDSRIETDFVGADLHYKLAPLTDRWSALFAGEEDAAAELLSEYRGLLKTEEANLTEANARTILVGPANKVRERRAERCTQQRLAVSYNYFLTHAKQQLPEETHKQILAEILRQEVDADLLLVGPIGNELAVFQYDGEEHSIARVYDFAAIGSGDMIAEANLFQRKHTQFELVPRTLYAVYEAQRNGRAAPGVGDDMTLVVIDSNGRWRQVTEQGEERLDALYVLHFGPRQLFATEDRVKEFLEQPLPDSFFVPDVP